MPIQPTTGRTASRDDSLDGDDGTWDHPREILLWGVLLPLALLAYIALDLYVGGVHLPRGRRSMGTGFYPFDLYPLVAAGVIGVKFFVATALVTYYVIGNHPTLGWYKDMILLPLLVLGGACLLLTIGGVLAA